MRKRPRILMLLVLMTALGLIALIRWGRTPRPTPPEVDVQAAEPAVAEAILQARERVLATPRDLGAWSHLGALLRASELFAEAAQAFATLETLDPTEVRWPYLHGESLSRRGEERVAVEPLLRAVALWKQSPGEVAIPLRLGEVFLTLGEAPKAEEALVIAREVDPDHPNVLLALAQAALTREDVSGARPLLQRCVRSPFTRKRAAVHLATLAQAVADGKTSQEWTVRASAWPPDLEWADPFVLECLKAGVGRAARFRYVEGLEARGRPAEAAEELRILAREDLDPRIHAGLIRNLLASGDGVAAEEAARRLLQSVPHHVQGHYLLGKILWTRAEGLWSKASKPAEAQRLAHEAIAEAETALWLKPDHAPAHLLIALSRRRLGQLSEARTALQRAVEAGPELPDPHFHLGELLLENGQREEGIRHLRLAAELAAPGDRRALQALEQLRLPP